MVQKFPKELSSYLDNFEDSVIEILTDRELFHTKVKYGIEGTISEHIGKILTTSFASKIKDSPNKHNGKIANKIIPHIRFYEVVDNLIPEGQETVQQRYLIGLLHGVKTYEAPGEEYWNKIRQSDFKVWRDKNV